MKNLILIIVFSALTLLGSRSMMAQTADLLAVAENTQFETADLDKDPIEQTISFGFSGGIISSDICGTSAGSFMPIIGLALIATAEIPMSDKIAVKPELQFATQGAKYEDEYYEGKYKLNYLNIPVFAKYYVTDGLSVEAGPQVGILLSAKDEYSSEGGSGKEDVKDQTKSVSFGAVAGVGYKLKNGINVGLRYNLGLTRIDNYSGEALIGNEDVKWKNHVMQLLFGYMF